MNAQPCRPSCPAGDCANCVRFDLQAPRTRCGREGHRASNCQVKLPPAKPGTNAGKDMGGIRDIEGIKRRCRIDPVNECWHYLAPKPRSGSSVAVQISLPDGGRMVTSLGAAVGWLVTGCKPPRGKLWVAMCGNVRCANPDHRKLKPRGYQSVIAAEHGRCGGPSLAEKIRRTKRARSRWSEADMQAIRDEKGTLAEIAERWGMSVAYASLIRRGELGKSGGAMASMAHVLGGA